MTPSNIYSKFDAFQAAQLVVEAEADLRDQELGCLTASYILSSVASNLGRRADCDIVPRPTEREEITGLAKSTLGEFDHLVGARRALNKFIVGIVQTDRETLRSVREVKERLRNSEGGIDV